jgi:hypothetical protein
MALQVSADAIRALIPDGVYSLQVLEQRDKQRVVVTFVLLSRNGGHGSLPAGALPELAGHCHLSHTACKRCSACTAAHQRWQNAGTPAGNRCL